MIVLTLTFFFFKINVNIIFININYIKSFNPCPCYIFDIFDSVNEFILLKFSITVTLYNDILPLANNVIIFLYSMRKNWMIIDYSHHFQEIKSTATIKIIWNVSKILILSREVDSTSKSQIKRFSYMNKNS